MNAKKETPMMRQYREAKENLPADALLLFRLGDFYEMFLEDAERGASILGITLTQRNGTPMAGIPYHAARTYIQKLLDANCKVAICDQMETPKPGKLVERSLSRILTPGTVLEDEQLNPRKGSYLAALDYTDAGWHAAWLDLSTGAFEITTHPRPDDVISCLDAIDPSEIVIFSKDEVSRFPKNVQWFFSGKTISSLDSEDVYERNPASYIASLLGSVSLDGFGIPSDHPALPAATLLLKYASKMLRSAPGNLRGIVLRRLDNHVRLDSATLRNLEIFSTVGNQKEGSLLHCYDHCVTAAGSRLLQRWFFAPIRDLDELKQRSNTVGAFHEASMETSLLRKNLAETRDMERILGRLQNRIRNPREIGGIRDTLLQIPAIRDCLQKIQHPACDQLLNRLDSFENLKEKLRHDLAEQLPGNLKEGGVFRDGIHQELDRLRSLVRNARGWVANLEQEEREKTGIRNLRIKYNGSFGYFIEVTKSNLSAVPDHYIRKQTMTNAERYYTDDLKEKEKEILHAEDKAILLEEELFQDLVRDVLEHAELLKKTASTLAEIDLLSGWSVIARARDYVKPLIDESLDIDIENGRHPVIEESLRKEPDGIAGTSDFVPNSCRLSAEGEQIAVLTGPNMAGKSTYIRQVALLTFLAHTGAWVPADRCRIGWVDRIFSRVGASDELARGNSTFMVEMNETANILNNSSKRSLVILDEIGRGTSTYDGLSIAWAVIENLHGTEGQGPRTLFATHYHELTQLEKTLPRLRNYSVAVKEWNDEIIFVRQVIPGAADRSYGIQVARLAGIPLTVIERAKSILEDLENNANQFSNDHRPVKNTVRKKARPSTEDSQLNLFE